MNSEWVISPAGPRTRLRLPILDAAGTRLHETQAALPQTPGFLMQRAGLALAQLALATAPHARLFWVACGRGNNGGDGLEAALHLHQWGKSVHISLPDGERALPVDATQALARVRAANMPVYSTPPECWDACIDALLGTGLREAPSGEYTKWIEHINFAQSPIISADVPSGLIADTGVVPGACVRANHTLAMLSLKPGHLMAYGRDQCGDIWLNTLGTEIAFPPCSWLNPHPAPHIRPHASHKGSYGDVAIVGGTAGMEGAALLAARAALQTGAGRVYLTLLGHADSVTRIPDVMLRFAENLDATQCTLVAGCGGGKEIANTLARWLIEAPRLVLDADALNSVAASAELQNLLQQRHADSTVITPHPLEAARLLQSEVSGVQADRLEAARQLSSRYRCVVILKGSGSVIAAPDRTPHINPTGNGRLAIAGTGDVLAGMIGTKLAQVGSAWEAACTACYQHGLLADHWPDDRASTASRFIASM